MNNLTTINKEKNLPAGRQESSKKKRKSATYAFFVYKSC
jgi:hypothetical protein